MVPKINLPPEKERFGEYYAVYESSGYANKARSEAIDRTTLTKLYNQHCRNFNISGPAIYRGIRHAVDDILYVDPTVSTRLSSNTVSFTMWLIESSSEWQHYPRRSKSIVCTTALDKAEVYGRLPYRVIPYDNRNIGICPTTDFFSSFIDHIGVAVPRYNAAMGVWLGGIYRAALKDSSPFDKYTASSQDDFNPDNTSESFIGYLDMLDTYIAKDPTLLDRVGADKDPRIKLYLEWDNLLRKGMPLKQILSAPLNPESNNFKIVNSDNWANANLRDGASNEVWTEGPALLVRHDLMDKYL